MTRAPLVQGWCPGALRPMPSGDGLVVRVRPHAGRLTPEQSAGLARAARAHGNGLIDLSSRANLQLRGVTPASHPALLADLAILGLIDRDLASESRRNITVSPFAQADGLAATLADALADLPPLPAKFGFALDVAPDRWLDGVPGDIRIERGTEGGLILRPDRVPTGRPVTEAEAPVLAVSLARWFVEAGGISGGRGRMAALIAGGACLPADLSGTAYPAPARSAPDPGLRPEGALLALAFGQMTADSLAALAALGHDLRLTPWRMLLLEGARRLPDLPGLPGVIADPADPLLRVVACTGAPGCPQALGETRSLARDLAPLVPRGGLLHVSGCTKGCAHPGAAPVTLTATGAGFAVVQAGRACDPGPVIAATDLPQILTRPQTRPQTQGP
ncbi:precorrin-3B synthase [Paracoccus subflavus]|uniref:Precorrin-3B synthase n=1 Tax=Paracoccus subflavus TaxID=2528244 RepID=A0A4Q9G8M0_9RHOB|nr:precorrin-3B synthase [Paracoccus subflavus]TBN42462.1 precorrin-3B synthase [Paracoccus subflavus]